MTIRSSLRTVYRLVIRLVAWCVLTPVILVFLIRNRRLFDAPVVMPFYIGSFGNSFLALDFAARLYAKSPISLVMVRDPEQNAYLPAMFGESMTVYWVDTLGFSPHTAGDILLTLVFMVSPLAGRVTIVGWEGLYRTLSLLPERVIGSEEQDCLLPQPYDHTGYVYLLEQGVGPQPSLPPDLIARCRAHIEAMHPQFFARPFITLLLRAKGHDEPELNARYRSSGPMGNYRAAVAHAIARGFHVVCAGETVNSAFSDMAGFFDLGEVPDAPGLMNLFVLSQCALFWGQQSGPLVVANSCGIPCLITDAMPYRHGTFGAKGRDIILYKPLTLRGQEAPLNLLEVYVNHRDLAYGYGFARKGVTIGCNSAEEIVKAMDEALDRLASPTPADVVALSDKLRELIEPAMPVHFHSSRPPEFILRSLPLK